MRLHAGIGRQRDTGRFVGLDHARPRHFGKAAKQGTRFQFGLSQAILRDGVAAAEEDRRRRIRIDVRNTHFVAVDRDIARRCWRGSGRGRARLGRGTRPTRQDQEREGHAHQQTTRRESNHNSLTR